MITRARVAYTALTLAICVPLYVLNPWVYVLKPGYTYAVDVVSGRPVLAVGVECAGFVLPAALPQGVRVAPGEVLCRDVRGREVFESLRLYVDTTAGVWVYPTVAYLYVSTSRAIYLEVVVEKPTRYVNLTAVLRDTRGRDTLLAVSLGEYGRYRVPVSVGSSTYAITLHLEARRPARDTFRVGIYLATPSS